MVMVVYFVISIIHSMAQSYHKQLTQSSSKSPSTSNASPVVKKSSDQSD